MDAPRKRQEHMPEPLWDGHVHLFPEGLMRAVYRFFGKHYGWQLPFPPSPEQLAEQLRQQGVAKAFALAYVHKKGLARQVNRWLAEFTAAFRWLIPFGAVHPEDEELDLVLEEALDIYNFAGLKLHCLVQRLRPDDKRLDRVYRALVERKRALVIHAGSFPLPAEGILGASYMAAVLRKFPRLPVIVAHLGLYDLAAYRELLPKYPGLYLDTAFVFQNQGLIPPLEEIAALIAAFPDRVIYGSDLPFILEPPANGIMRILELGLGENVYRRLFYENARSFLEALSR